MSDVASESSEPFGGSTPIPPTFCRTMVQSQLVRGVMEAAVLAAAAEEDVYGYDFTRRFRAAGLAEVADASVYSTLRGLHRAGLLTSYVAPSGSGPHRRYYGITNSGRAALASSRETWEAFSAATEALLGAKDQRRTTSRRDTPRRSPDAALAERPTA